MLKLRLSVSRQKTRKTTNFSYHMSTVIYGKSLVPGCNTLAYCNDPKKPDDFDEKHDA